MEFNNMPSFGSDNDNDWNAGVSDSDNEFGLGFGQKQQSENRRTNKSNGFSDFISEYYIDIICCVLIGAFVAAVVFNWQLVMDALFVFVLFPIIKFLGGILLIAIIVVVLLVIIHAMFSRPWR